MRENLVSRQFWSYVLLIVCLCTLAALFGSTWDWTPGAASLAVLAVPCCAAALTGRRALSMAIAFLSAVACFVEAWIRLHLDATSFTVGFPLLAAGVLLFTNGIVALRTRRWQRENAKLAVQNSDRPDDVVAPTGNNRQSEMTPPELLHSSRIVPLLSEPMDDTVDQAMLLLTLQDISRRVSSNLDLETLIPTIISTAKASLGCSECHVYYWNAREGSLSCALPPRARDNFKYTPRTNSGMAGWVIENRQILTLRDIEADYALSSILEEEPHLPDAIAPLAVGGELLGLMIVDQVEQDSQSFLKLLYILATNYALGIKNAQLFKRIEEMARYDGQTGLLNHASFREELEDAVKESKSNSAHLTVMMCDLDHFKKLNDTYGHQAGDHVLSAVANMFHAVFPEYAVVGRYGGEEFICALPHDDVERAQEFAEDLRELVASQVYDFQGEQLKASMSIGLAELGPETSTIDDLTRAADMALYQAKNSGRNRVVCHAHC